MALYAKMVNLHSCACASAKMENSKQGLPSSVLCVALCRLVCVCVCVTCTRTHNSDDSASYTHTRADEWGLSPIEV